MAQGVRKSLDEKIADKKAKIAELETEINELIADKEKAEYEKLKSAIDKSGMSLSDVIGLIEKND
jgi:cell division protein FtsL